MLGVLGLGSQSTVHFIDRLNKLYNYQNGDFSTCPFVMLNADFNQINPYLPNDFEKLIPILTSKLMELNELGVSRIAVPNITIHETIDQLDPILQSTIIHPLKLGREIAGNSKKTKVLILGTRYTMQSNYVLPFFRKMESIQLNEYQLETIDSIRKKVYEAGHTELLQQELEECIKNVVNDEVLIVVACTELSLIANNTDWLDLLEVQVQESIVL